jgi:PAS domain S-box-containing protein
MKNHDQPIPIVFQNLKSKYYKTIIKRVSAKSANLVKPDRDKKLIVKLRAEIKRISFKLRAVFDSSNSYFIILDKQLNILDYNKASFHFIKRLFNKNMVVGDSIFNFIHQSSAKMVNENCERSFAGEKFIIERKVRYQDSSITWWSFEFSPATDLRGNITGVVFNANDVTKRKAYEEKILSQHKKLVDISVMQSHEIRGPASTIMGLMSLIKENDYEPDRECLLLMEITADQLDKNIREIVDRANDDLNIG